MITNFTSKHANCLAKYCIPGSSRREQLYSSSRRRSLRSFVAEVGIEKLARHLCVLLVPLLSEPYVPHQAARLLPSIGSPPRAPLTVLSRRLSGTVLDMRALQCVLRQREDQGGAHRRPHDAWTNPSQSRCRYAKTCGVDWRRACLMRSNVNKQQKNIY